MKSTRTQHLETALIISAGMLVFSLITKNPLFQYLGLGIALLAIFWEKGAALLHTGWMRLAEFLGKINGSILLSLVFFLILTPLALLAKLSRNNSLGLKRKQGESYWHKNEKTYTAKDLEHPW